jgi:hypothetical protein
MELSFAELAVLAAAGSTPRSTQDLAKAGAALYQSTKYDATLALVDIRTLIERRFLVKNKTGTVELTREGWAAVIQALPVIENLRAAVAGVGYRALR